MEISEKEIKDTIMTQTNRMLALAAGISMIFASGSAAPQYKQLTDLPTVYINTENSAGIYSKEDYVRASIVWVDAEGTQTYEENLGIRGRGNSTWGLAKKPYRIKFDKKTEFLGPEKAKAKSWTLLANYADKTLLRNAVAAYIGTFVGQPFTAAARFVDVVLNGEYLGNYQISDQMEIRPKRVDITEQDVVPEEGANISGGYFLEVDGFAASEPSWFMTGRGVKITIKSPDSDIIVPSQTQYIKKFIEDFETALFSDNFTDPEKGYRKYVDAETLASWYISTELTGNVDGFWSTYIYKEKDDDHIYWGPLWDYDIAFNNCNRTGEVTRSLMTERGFGSDLTKLWVNRMWQDPWFAILINNKWKQLVEDGIEEAVLKYIDRMAAEVDQSQALNYRKWKINERAYNEIMLFDTYKEGVDYLKKFISEHTPYLTQAFQQKVDDIVLNIPSAAFEHDGDYSYRIVNKGTHKIVGINDEATGVCIRDENPDDMSQEWRLVPDGEWFHIVNHGNGLAITDMAQYNGWNGYNTGSQLGLSEMDADNEAQQWKISPISTGASYCMVNRATNLAWNNSGGSAADGTHVISWTNDNQNANKATRQWHLNKSTMIASGVPTGVPDAGEPQYYVSYDPAARELHFVSRDCNPLEGTVAVYSLSGALLMNTDIAGSVSLAGLEAGQVVVAWTIDSKTRSAKVNL